MGKLQAGLLIRPATVVPELNGELPSIRHTIIFHGGKSLESPPRTADHALKLLHVGAEEFDGGSQRKERGSTRGMSVTLPVVPIPSPVVDTRDVSRTGIPLPVNTNHLEQQEDSRQEQKNDAIAANPLEGDSPPILQLYTIPLKTVKRLMRPHSTATSAISKLSKTASLNAHSGLKRKGVLPAIPADRFSVDRVLRLLDPPNLVFDSHTGEPKIREEASLQRVVEKSTGLEQAIKRLQKAVVNVDPISRPATTRPKSNIRDVIPQVNVFLPSSANESSLPVQMVPHISPYTSPDTTHHLEVRDGLERNLLVMSAPTVSRFSTRLNTGRSCGAPSSISPWPEELGSQSRGVMTRISRAHLRQKTISKMSQYTIHSKAVTLPTVSPIPRATEEDVIQRENGKPIIQQVDCHMPLSRVLEARQRPKEPSYREIRFFQQNFVSAAPALNLMMQLSYTKTIDKMKKNEYQMAVDRVTRARAEAELSKLVVKEKRDERGKRVFSPWSPQDQQRLSE